MRKIKLWKRLTALALSAVLLIPTSVVFAEESGQAEQNLQAREADGFVIEDEQAEQDEQTEEAEIEEFVIEDEQTEQDEHTRKEVDEPVTEEEQEELNTRTREAATDGLVIEDGVLVEYTGESANVIIPDGVTSIGGSVFSGCGGLRSVKIPSSVTNIGYRAFCDCSGLTSIEIPTSVTSIGEGAFWGCDGLTSIEIPSNVTSIGDGAFFACRGLTSIEILSSITRIEEDVFSNCSNLTSVKIPSSVTSIGSGAFQRCSSLTSIEIPSSVTNIGGGAFSSCSSLISIKIPGSVTSIGSGSFEQCTSLKNVEIPTSVISIGHETFRGCDNLTNIEIHANITSIEYGTFYSCDSLTSIEIPGSVTSIERDAFFGCSSLKNIEIPTSVTSIGDDAFNHCSSFTSMIIPENVTSIGRSVFFFCTSLISIKVDEKNQKYDSRNDCNAIVETESDTLIAGCKKTVIPFDVTSIGDRAFNGCSGLTSIEIPPSVTSIGEKAFSFSSDLASVEIPSSVTSIGDDAFRLCSNLTRAEIPSSVVNIGINAFEYCRNLTIYGVLGSYAETYANANNIPFIDPAKIVGIEVATASQNDIVTQVYDVGDERELFARVMKDAAVNVDKFGSTSTDEKGKAVIANNLTDQPLVNTRVSVAKEGYREYYFYRDIYNRDAELLWNSNQQTVYMRKLQEGDESNPYISTLMCQSSFGRFYDAMTVGRIYHSMESSQNVTLQINAVWNGKTPSSYILYQENGISYTSADGKFHLDMGEDFKAEYPIYAKLVAADGTTVTEKTKIEIKGSSSVSSSSGNSLNLIDTDSTGTLGEDIAFLSGENVSIKLGGAKLDISVEAGKIRATIGKKNESISSAGEMFSNEKWEEWKKLCEHQPTDLNLSQWKNVIESIDTNYTGSIKGKTDVYGYLEGTMNDAGQTILTGKLKLKASIGVGIQTQYMVGVVPVYAKMSVGAEGGAEGTLSYNWTEKKLDAEKTGITLSMEPYLTAEGGLGVMAVAEVGVEGKGSMPFSTKIGMSNETKIFLKGGLSLKVKLLAFEYSLKLAERELQLLPSEKSCTAAKTDRISELSMEDFALSDHHHMEEESLWLGDRGIQTLSLETTETNVVERVLKTNINPDADMQMVTAGNTKMILWTESDPQRTSVNSSKLVYSIYNETNDTWSVPEAVADDGTADFTPSAVSDGEHIYVAWQNIGKKFTDEAELSEVAAVSTAAMSIWTSGKGFSKAVVVSKSGCMASAPKIALNAEGKPYIAYLQNTDNNLLLTTGQNNICYSIVDGSEIEHKSFVENAGLVTAMDTSYTNGYEISYTLDTDDNLSTLDDREIIKKGTKNATTKNDCMDSNVQYVKNGGSSLRFWYQNGKIIMSDQNGNETIVYQDNIGTLTDDFHVVNGKENQLAVIWTAVDRDENRQIEGSLYDPDKKVWSKSIQISDTDANVYNPQGNFTVDGNLQFLYKKTGNRQTDLCILMVEPSVNLTVENAYCDEISFMPGNTAKVNIQIKNNGSKSANGFMINIEGTKTAVSDSLAPGESIAVKADYVVPADINYREISIAVEADGDIDTTDNRFSLLVGHTDLVISVTDSKFAFGQLVEIGTANHSCVDTAAALEVRKGSQEGELIKSIDLGTVKKGELVTVTYLWNKDAENYSADAETLYFNVVSEKQEKYTDNNYDFIAVDMTDETPGCTEHIWSEGKEIKAPTCTAKGERGFACTICGAEKTEEISATGHQNTEVRNKRNAGCKSKGYSGDVYCKKCGVKLETGQVIEATGKHTWNKGKEIKASTCKTKGEKEYTCAVCGEKKKEEVDKKAHAYKTTVTKATTAKNGNITNKCTVCGAKSKKTIFFAKSVNLKTITYTYNGKKKKPAVTVKDSKGKVIHNRYYTVTYKNNVKVGKAAVTIKLKGNYKGTLARTFRICPKGTSISGKIKAKSKEIVVKWKKQAKSTTGYQIQISTSKKFAKKATVTKTVKKNSTTKLTVKKLKPKKKYYVRVRTYKTVNGKEYCSGWSKIKSVTTKK